MIQPLTPTEHVRQAVEAGLPSIVITAEQMFANPSVVWDSFLAIKELNRCGVARIVDDRFIEPCLKSDRHDGGHWRSVDVGIELSMTRGMG